MNAKKYSKRKATNLSKKKINTIAHSFFKGNTYRPIALLRAFVTFLNTGVIVSNFEISGKGPWLTDLVKVWQK